MKKILITLLFLPIILLLTKFNVNAQTQVDFHTNYGDFRIQLYDSLVPVTSSNKLGGIKPVVGLGDGLGNTISSIP